MKGGGPILPPPSFISRGLVGLCEAIIPPPFIVRNCRICRRRKVKCVAISRSPCLVPLPSMARSCQFCRRRKIKCDADKPSCLACRSRNRPCLYDSGQRRQRPSAALISSLQGEKSALEEVLSQLKTASDDQRHALLESVKIRNGSVSLSPRARSSFSTVPL